MNRRRFFGVLAGAVASICGLAGLAQVKPQARLKYRGLVLHPKLLRYSCHRKAPRLNEYGLKVVATIENWTTKKGEQGFAPPLPPPPTGFRRESVDFSNDVFSCDFRRVTRDVEVPQAQYAWEEV